ncbi:MAG: DUF4011 domain-containing protein [Butyrivibrio sp.]|nr:DUF4011 domain-containing protein [Butyrivibrio sp.]
MDIKKLDRWAELLLDIGKRNYLINFRDTKTSTVEIVAPTPDVLWEKVNGSGDLEVYDPKIIDIDNDIEQITLEDSERGIKQNRDEYLQTYRSMLKKANQVLLYSLGPNSIRTLQNIDKKAQSAIDETGVNVAYMAFGFIHWKESDSSQYEYRAPILLVPVQFSRETAVAPYHITAASDEIIVNPTFSYKLNAEHSIRLPEYADEGLDSYLDKVSGLVRGLKWSITKECKIGLFSFLKMNMYRDLKDHANAILKNRNILALLGEQSENAHNEGNFDERLLDYGDALLHLHSVVDADSSQIEAIEMAKSGVSFVLQGPPGTGKSQTITNIIAECLNDGKKVLFVSEKLAALNVVYDKLRLAGLTDFCLELHSHKANRKDVIAELCRTLRSCKTTVSPKADEEVATKIKAQRQLDLYAEELHRQRPVIEKSLYQLYEAHSAYRDIPEFEFQIVDIEAKGASYLTSAIEFLDRYVDYLPSVGYDYHKNPWYGYKNQDTSYQTMTQVRSDLQESIKFFRTLISVSDELTEKYDIACAGVEDAKFWRGVMSFTATSDIITPTFLQNTDLMDTLRKMLGLSTEIIEIQTILDAAYGQKIYQLDGSEYHQKLTTQFSGFFSRIFNQKYRQMVTSIQACKRNEGKLSYQDAVTLARQLSEYQEKVKVFETFEGSIKEHLGLGYAGLQSNWAHIKESLAQIESFASKGYSYGRLAELSPAEFQAEQSTFEEFEKKLSACFDLQGDWYERLAAAFDDQIFDLNNTQNLVALAKFENCHSDADKIDNWCRFRTLLSQLRDMELLSFVDYAISQNYEAKYIVAAYKRAFYHQWIDCIITTTPVLADFNRVMQDRAVTTFSQKDTLQFEISKVQIRQKLSAKRPSLDMVSSGSAVSILLREGEKKRRQKNIRALLAETGELIQILKPCFMMSPLSVSTFLDSNTIYFDTVIFDEASQIFPQDAVGAIYRGKQLIVVGDSKQMPPSNFFSATVGDDSLDEETGDVTDFESILDMCATAMPQMRLRWHYRSRYEQLIAFSNRNFYDGDLITFPSTTADTHGIGVDYYHVDGMFDRKSHTNRKEAEFIVDLIFRHIEEYPDRSLGVVAFSVAQQELIDDLLSKRRQTNPDTEGFFKGKNREPFFVKNLETVQGDERDTIIFSVAYGIDSQGRLLHNFGPLNRVGGERRLNVAVTRAKYNVQLVSSMHYTDIDLSRTSSTGAALLRAYLDYAENGTIALERTISVNPFEQFDSEFKMEVCDFLRENGFEVDTQVGCSGFRIDLGLRRPGGSDYILAIECDGATYHSSKNARDRDRLRQEILERMGWNFYRIWSTDWFKNKRVEKERLREAATQAVKAPIPAYQPLQKPEEPHVEEFEVLSVTSDFKFPEYVVANVNSLAREYLPNNFKGMVKAILDVEAPLSEELLLKRTVMYFGREKVTSVVQRTYERLMLGCQREGIIRKHGFLYLQGQTEFPFRAPSSDLRRDIKDICPEELAAGLLELLLQNVTADKSGLYHVLAEQCGCSRVGKAINERFDDALNLLRDQVDVDGDMISIKHAD